MSVRVKVCGITNRADAAAAVAAGADALGFMFVESSPRCLRAEAAADIIRGLPPAVTRVGVFVNAPEGHIRQIAGVCGLDVVQLHGEETPQFCASLGNGHSGDVLGPPARVPGPAPPASLRVIKAFRIRDRNSLEALASFANVGWLLDSYVAGQAGGTGARFNWDLAVAAQATGHPIILAGGLNAQNVAEALRQVRPYGVDVSSGVESAPGRKDPAKLRAFVQAVRDVLP